MCSRSSSWASLKYIGKECRLAGCVWDERQPAYGMMPEAIVAKPHLENQTRAGSWIGLSNQKAAQEDAQAQAQEDA
jgi:hypothetical protein